MINKEKDYSSLQITNNWNFPSPIKNALEGITAILQIIQARFFIYLLGENSEEVMEMQDSTLAGQEFWKYEEHKDGEDIANRAIDDMLNAQSPQYSLEEELKRGLGSLKGLASQLSAVHKNDKIKVCVLQAKKVFQTLASALFQSLHHSLMHEKREDGIEVVEFITMLFRLNRKNFVIKNKEVAPLFSNPDCDVINTCEKVVFIDNHPKLSFFGQVPGAYMWELE